MNEAIFEEPFTDDMIEEIVYTKGYDDFNYNPHKLILPQDLKPTRGEYIKPVKAKIRAFEEDKKKFLIEISLLDNKAKLDALREELERLKRVYEYKCKNQDQINYVSEYYKWLFNCNLRFYRAELKEMIMKTAFSKSQMDILRLCGKI